MLLPQGEFARFLRSDDDARRAVLTKLFGTELYDSITAELDRRRADGRPGAGRPRTPRSARRSRPPPRPPGSTLMLAAS